MTTSVFAIPLRRNSGRLKLFITYDNCDEVREMYRWAAHFYDKEWNYCISRTDDQKNGTDQKGSRKKGKRAVYPELLRRPPQSRGADPAARRDTPAYEEWKEPVCRNMHAGSFHVLPYF